MENSCRKILMVDDDQDLCELMVEYLCGEGFDVTTLSDGQKAIEILRDGVPYDLLILDIMMPAVTGLDVLQFVRHISTIPVIMLTGKGDDIDRIIGLEMGADDYIGKPCNPRELVARVRAILRRSKTVAYADSVDIIELGGMTLNSGAIEAHINGEKLALTSAEFRTLELFVRHVGQTLSKEFLTQTVLNRKLTRYDRSIDVHISRVRQKLVKYPEFEFSIKSLRGVGYQLTINNATDV